MYGPDDGERSKGKSYKTTRPPKLLNDKDGFVTVKAPSFSDFSLKQVVNVKNVCKYPVKGDGKTDE